MKTIKIFAVIACVFAALVGAVMFVARQRPAERSVVAHQPLKILWAEWQPAEALQELSKDFTRETGIPVRIETEPWATYQGKAFTAMDSHSRDHDLMVGDSQWLGYGATRGHYVDLTEWIAEHGVDKTMLPATLSGYAEFPKGGGTYWAVPLEGDAYGFAYRKDLFEDPKERSAFRTEYGYDLAVPETWAQLRDIVEFFHRPKDGLSGIYIHTQKDYDAITGGFDNVLFSWGGELGSTKTYRTQGMINSPDAVKALEFYKSLYAFAPPGSDNGFWFESNQAMIDGKVALAMNLFAFFPDLADPRKNPRADVTGYFAMPKGPRARYATLGGQGISINSYSNRQDDAFRFLEWLIRQDVQERWARLGGFTCDRRVLSSETFLKAAPYNPALAESLAFLKDFWTVPEYADLLSVSQKYLHAYVTNPKSPLTAKQTLDRIAEEWENIFRYAGYY